MTISEERTCGFLEFENYAVTKIEETDDKRCDFLVKGPESSYLIEVKERELSDEEQRGIKEQEIYEHPSVSLGYNEPLKRVIRNGVSQLKKTGLIIKSDFRLLWIDLIDPFNAYKNYSRLLCTAYGMAEIYHHSAQVVPCYYFTHSSFFTHKDLDGIIVIWNDREEIRLELLVNNHAHKYEQFKSCDLLKSTFLNAHRDPNKLEPPYIIADCDIDRNNSVAVLKYLSDKYGLIRPERADLESHTITATIERKSKKKVDGLFKKR